MHLLFIDESGSVPSPNKMTNQHFVVGGIIIPEDQWHHIEADLIRLKELYGIEGEVKWRYFGQQIGKEQKENNLKHLDRLKRDELRFLLFAALAKYQSIKTIACITQGNLAYRLPFIKNEEDLYWNTYKPVTERFQYHLQDLSRQIGSKVNGIIICDHRAPHQDAHIRMLHAKLLSYGMKTSSRYENLIEGLFLAPSQLSIGIQFADMVVGAIYRKFEHEDDKWFRMLESTWRKSPLGIKEGYGLVKFPKYAWEENDAESRLSPEPAILTQSQRTSIIP